MDPGPSPTVDAFAAHRPNLTGHCYRMLGSLAEADDAVQETLVRAWRHRDRFEGRSAIGTWLHRIATNVCLDALRARKRRSRPQLLGPAGTIEDELVERGRTHWIEPVPDSAVVDPQSDPRRQLEQRERVRLAFVTALHQLPPKQRAALLLVEVVGCSAAEAAETLETTVPALNSALQRARATLGDRVVDSPTELDDAQRALLDRYVEAFERYDVDALTALMHEDATLSMPPYTLWLRGPDTIARWLAGRGNGCRGSRLVPTMACGRPAFGQYRPSPDGGHDPWALVLLEMDGEGIHEWISFLDTEALFPRFGLPGHLPEE